MGEVRDLLDELWFVEAPASLRERRLLERHVQGGRTEAEAQAFIASSERPNAARVEATRAACGRVVRPA